MKGTGLKLLCLAGIWLTAFSCSTEVDLRADWQDITVILGILDQDDDIHYVKINKTFLGKGNAFEYAQVRDSSEYDVSDVDAKIEEKVNGNIVRVFNLRDTLLTNKESGIFYGPDHIVYYFKADDLNPNAEYDLSVAINTNDGETKFVTATTPLVKPFTMSKPTGNDAQQITFYLGSNYFEDEIVWFSAVDGKRYEVSLTFNYLEVNQNNDSIPRSISWSLGTQKINDLDGGVEMSKVIGGESFFKWLADRIVNTPELNGSDVTHRIFRGLDFNVTVAADELNTYMELNEPVTGIVQERPSYTNVTNGIGLFSARYSEERQGKWLNKASIQHLHGGQYTSSLKFCSDSLGLWPNNDQDPSWCQ